MYALIMAGGRGTRFWPRSREKYPKHLLDIVGKQSLIQDTVDRIAPIVATENIYIVTGAPHADELMKQLPHIPKSNILIEPIGRNTAPCIGLASLTMKRKASDEVMCVLPADHVILQVDEFREVLHVAAEAAHQGDHLVTIGITPKRPEVGYGYLEQGNFKMSIRGRDVYEVASIREKPPRETAEQFLRMGRFFWNSGMFIWRISSILKAIETYLPDLYQSLLRIEEVLGTPKEAEVIEREYTAIHPISIDYGVMEKAHNVLLVKGDFGWSDVGSWDALWEVTEKDGDGVAVHSCSSFVGIDIKNTLVYSSRKLVALLGIEDLIVVDTDDALLICRRGMSQDVRKIVDEIERRKLNEYL